MFSANGLPTEQPGAPCTVRYVTIASNVPFSKAKVLARRAVATYCPCGGTTSKPQHRNPAPFRASLVLGSLRRSAISGIRLLYRS